MTREEQRYLRELKKPFETACRSVGKRRGWKSISGIQYQVRNGMLYELFPDLSWADRGKALKAWLCCKPVVLDEMYWDVFHMREEAAKMPFSFHVNGAFTAPVYTLDRWKTPLPGPEILKEAVDALLDQAEALVEEHPFPTLADFRRAVETEPANSGRTLNIVLCLLCEGAYEEAAREISAALARGEAGGFLRMDGNQAILEDARDWCAERAAEELGL